MPKIDFARLNALRPQPKPSDNPQEATSLHSDDSAASMEIDRVPMGRSMRKRKEKVAKHLKRGANEKEMESFQKRVFMIPLEKPFEEAYFTHRLWMFFRETRETEEDIRIMFCEGREKMKKRITLKKKSDPEKFVIPCTVKGGAFHGIIHLCGLFSEELMRNHKRPRGELVDSRSNVQYANQPVMPDAHRSSSCHCGAEYETKYSASIETHTATSIDSAHQKSIDSPKDESVDSSPSNWENDYYNPTIATHTRETMHKEKYDEDYEEERAIEYIAILDEEDRLLHHSSWKRNAPSIDRIADDHHHESYAVEIEIHELGADELHEGFRYEELLNMQRRDETDQHRAEASGGRTRFHHPIDIYNNKSTDNHRRTSVDEDQPLESWRHIAEDREHNCNNEGRMAQRR
ncbi:hypothetical protein F2Q69_00052742 [Brassica cretica]|uniref:Uncharacterized protein n=1 Tax=Brassica cretica TaxID=69181 RepID=A0A8S9MYA7_BRACR|nr:hypothetical protein F2Q69_00052742 [Brassica cretica]